MLRRIAPGAIGRADPRHRGDIGKAPDIDFGDIGEAVAIGVVVEAGVQNARALIEGPHDPKRKSTPGPMRAVVSTANRTWFDSEPASFLGTSGYQRGEVVDAAAVERLRVTPVRTSSLRIGDGSPPAMTSVRQCLSPTEISPQPLCSGVMSCDQRPRSPAMPFNRQ